MATTNTVEPAASGFEQGDIDGDREEAVRRAYAGMSTVLAERLDIAAETHSELVAGAEAAGLNEDAMTALRRVTSIYERCVFSPEQVSPSEARWAVGVASRLQELAG